MFALETETNGTRNPNPDSDRTEEIGDECSLEQNKKQIAVITEDGKMEMNALSEEIKKEIAVITEDRKMEMNALTQENKQEIVAIQVKLNTMIQEKGLLKSAKSLKLDAEAAQAKNEATQAKEDRSFNLMTKRKELGISDFSAIEIEERLPFPQQDDDERSNKRRRRVVKKEEISAYSSSSEQELESFIDCNFDFNTL
jgi:hypothetical protein